MMARSIVSKAGLVVAGSLALIGSASGQELLDQIVVTATGRPERQSQIAGTTQVIDRERIEHSSAKSVTDLLAENAVGFLSEWTPGQTSINIRGAASDGQGRDFKGQVLVLINGRRAGTANISKLSNADIERIEIVRGPASVIYGSQNLGGVINIIMKTGRSAPGTLLEGTTGAWNLMQGRAQSGGVLGPFDYYFGASGGKRDDYHAGSGSREVNTDWKRQGFSSALGYAFNEDHRVDFSIRKDGIYDVGFRGSGANYLSRDDRFNGSIDSSYTGQIEGGRVAWFVQYYAVNDVDRFKWASPITRGSNGLPAAGTAADFNRRNLDIMGTRIQPRVKLWEGNELLLGYDWEESVLRSDRFRAGTPGNVLAQISPYDNNQTDRTQGLYFEDAQGFFDDRLIVRGGVRQTYGRTSFELTPYLSGQQPRTNSYEATTYSTGGTLKATDWLTFRVGASTGFRAPTATEIAADFTALGGGRTFGNASLKPETSNQIEAGATLSGPGWRFDAALFQNIIEDRITTRLRPNVANTSDYINNPGSVIVDGLEFQLDTDLASMVGLDASAWRWRGNANANWNFDMKDKGSLSVATANTHNAERVYRYQAALGSRFGSAGTDNDWTLQVQGILRGPVYYNSEENLLVPLAEPYREYIWRKNPFWAWNARFEVELAKGVQLYLSATNIFNVNQHPIYLALDGNGLADLRFYNGGNGTSMPGRDVQVGVQARF